MALYFVHASACVQELLPSLTAGAIGATMAYFSLCVPKMYLQFNPHVMPGSAGSLMRYVSAYTAPAEWSLGVDEISFDIVSSTLLLVNLQRGARLGTGLHFDWGSAWNIMMRVGE